MINIATGLLENVAFHRSPNQDARPDDVVIDLLVIHNISLPPKEFGGDAIDAFFTNQLNFADHPYFQTLRELKVSAHVVIRRDGQKVQYVPFNARAWHAGKSNYLGREQCNDFSIGIELEGADDIPYTMAQYHQLASLIKLLRHYYPGITKENIVGHSDIAPGRKTDPGPAFDWLLLKELL